MTVSEVRILSVPGMPIIVPGDDLAGLIQQAAENASLAVQDGDIVVVRLQQGADNGDIVVARMGEEATVKRFYREKDAIRLQPENPSVAPIYSADVEICGKVVALVRPHVF